METTDQVPKKSCLVNGVKDTSSQQKKQVSFKKELSKPKRKHRQGKRFRKRPKNRRHKKRCGKCRAQRVQTKLYTQLRNCYKNVAMIPKPWIYHALTSYSSSIRILHQIGWQKVRTRKMFTNQTEMNSDRHSPRRRNVSRSPHYSRSTSEYNERSLSPHRRYSSGRRSPSTSPHNQISYKSQYRNSQDSDYSDGGRHSRNSRRSYSSGSDFEYVVSREKDRDYDHGRDRDRDREWERERERERSRSREYRDRHHHKDRDYDSHHRDRFRRDKGRDRRSNKENRRSRDRDRDRDRSYRDEDRDSNEGRDRSPVSASAGNSFDSGFYKNQPPNNTIMIRGLAQHITENDVRQDIINCGLMPKDIRLIRKKDTGASRGFAFVEFTTLQEAMRWMEMKQGVLMLQDQYRAIMQYSIPKDASQQSEKPPSSKATADWFCIKCGAQNFKRRDNCFKCHASRMESEEGGSGSDEVCTYATKTIMLRNLDALTTEDSVMGVLKGVVPELISTISGVCIGRDPLTSTSRGICYLALESTVDALALYGALTSLETPLAIDGKTAIISYCKYHMGDVKKAFSQMQFPTASQPNVYSMNDLNSLADYSASRYAKTAAEYQQYFQYYKMYFAQQINEGVSITLNSENQMDSANAAAALAQNAILQRNSSKAVYDPSCTVPAQIPNGLDGKKYPVPDVTKYHYDKNTGYYYDPTTGLYYDRNSQYYYNSVIQKYLYWDNEKCTYLLAPTSTETVTAGPTTSSAAPGDSTTAPDAKKSKVEKQDRVKVAKKIAKDMERWAKNLNQKKESTRTPTSNEVQGIQSNGTSTASADIGFAVLEKKSAASASQTLNVFSGAQKNDTTYLAKSQAEGLVAAYGGSSDTSGDEETADDGADCLDWDKLVCLLCKRQFFSKEDLSRHKEMSALHKKNLELRYLQKSLESGKKLKYRDRAKERRLKYGESDEPQPSRLKEKYLKAREVPEPPVVAASASDPIGSENVGNRLLQKMGWTEGQGLGKSNQGRTTIIQAEQRLSTVGLGSKTATYTALPGETYKDCVKKMMFARYQELTEQG